jgi:hypothetical protein
LGGLHLSKPGKLWMGKTLDQGRHRGYLGPVGLAEGV